MKNYLPPEKAIELVAALVDAGQCTPNVRTALLASIDKGFVTMLPVQNTPFEQIWMDLNTMNGVSVLANQQIPLLIWLQNAAQWLKMTGFPQEAGFQQAAAVVAAESQRRLQAGGAAATTPALPFYLTESQKEYREYLEQFLRPLEMRLHYTASVFALVRDSEKMNNLEHFPDVLQRFYTSLPIGDPRRDLWKTYVDELQKENRKAIELVEAHYGKIVLPQFRTACDEYLEHAKLWGVVWNALAGNAPLPGSLASDQRMIAPPFPSRLEQSLADEMAEVSRRAGLA
jgi:hypothetical protein